MIHYHILKTPLSGRCEALRYGFATGYRQLTMVTTNHINVSRLRIVNIQIVFVVRGSYSRELGLYLLRTVLNVPQSWIVEEPKCYHLMIKGGG